MLKGLGIHGGFTPNDHIKNLLKLTSKEIYVKGSNYLFWYFYYIDNTGKCKHGVLDIHFLKENIVSICLNYYFLGGKHMKRMLSKQQINNKEDNPDVKTIGKC